jgi:hypothetical protein
VVGAREEAGGFEAPTSLGRSLLWSLIADRVTRPVVVFIVRTRFCGEGSTESRYWLSLLHAWKFLR